MNSLFIILLNDAASSSNVTANNDWQKELKFKFSLEKIWLQSLFGRGSVYRLRWLHYTHCIKYPHDSNRSGRHRVPWRLGVQNNKPLSFPTTYPFRFTSLPLSYDYIQRVLARISLQRPSRMSERDGSIHSDTTRDKQTTANVTGVVAWRFRRVGINSVKFFLASSC
jgi:hypothetical protein